MQSTNNKLVNLIQKTVTDDGKPIPKSILISKVCRAGREYSKHDIISTIENMIKSGNLRILLKSQKIIMGYPAVEADLTKLYEGTIRVNAKGSGFINLEGEDKSKYFVYKTNLNGAMDGDKVQFALLKKAPEKDLIDATIIKVLEHGKDFYTGLIQIDENGQFSVKVDDEKMYLPIKLDSYQGLVNGQKVLIKIKTYEQDAAYGSVVRIIGHSSDVGVDILSIVYDKGVEPDFTQDVLEYSRKLTLEIDEHQKQIRKDLTNLPIVTIDPATSKDFDDAIYVKKIDEQNFLLSVSIADVSHYVRMNSILDQSALKRGCSIYLVDRVIPMLPHNLSDDLCSLNPNVERLTITCDMVIDNKGQIKDIKVFPAIIKSHRRFSYDEVNEYFSKKSSLDSDTQEIKQMLNDALELH
ncbi:MAG: RNB domain-containing ribonuclease [Mycoplasmoidaceae bacterium]|nr:RNB domain-containing ribonuclease [Mycoplasmoidaceae bacterium]